MSSSPGSVRCPACGQKALPMQSHCTYCNARLNEVLPVESTDREVVPLPSSELAPPAKNACLGCGKPMKAEAVLCIDCGYDRRTGSKRETVVAVTPHEPEPEVTRRKRKRRREPLSAGFHKVQLGLGFHYARLGLTLLALLVALGLVCYMGIAKPKEDDLSLLIVQLTAMGIVQFAAALGVIGSILCLWVGRSARARGFILATLVLDVLTLPLLVSLQIAALPIFLGWIFPFASWHLFLLFLRRLAQYLDRPDEANEAMALLIRSIALLVLVPLLLVLLGMFAYLYGALSKTVAGLILGISLVIILVQIIFMVKLVLSIIGNIQTLRAAIASQLDRSTANMS